MEDEERRMHNEKQFEQQVSTSRNSPEPGGNQNETSRTQLDTTNPYRLRTDTEADISRTSFRRWHRHLQNEHIRMKRSSFTLWGCCNKACRPCRWFDSIDYEKKLCKCCFKFKTFKSLSTLVLIALFFYLLSYTFFDDEVLPGGTIFFLYILFLTAYATGYLIMLIGVPPMLAHLISGIIFKNLPDSLLPNRDDVFVDEVTRISEVAKTRFFRRQILLVIALIRGGLLLDLSRIKNRVRFIVSLSIFPFFCEFVIVIISGHFLLGLPWDWSALQGSVMGVVSLASVTSVMHKNRSRGYGEEKNLNTVLIAAAVLNVVSGLFFYAVSITYTLPEGQVHNFVEVMPFLLEEIALGLSTGGISGFLISFFPDKRNTEAAVIRILLIGLSSFALAKIFNDLSMIAAAGVGCITLCVIAANMWEEIGWHNDNNPVQYFYTMIYYFCQPMVISLVGYTMNFKDAGKEQIGLSIALVLIGLAGRESVCFLTTTTKLYPTSSNEKLFICIAWITKGTFQVLLASNIEFVVNSYAEHLDHITFKDYKHYAVIVKETTVIAILLSTPIACISLTLLTPVLLTRSTTEITTSGSDLENQYTRPNRGSSIKYIGKYSTSQ